MRFSVLHVWECFDLFLLDSPLFPIVSIIVSGVLNITFVFS